MTPQDFIAAIGKSAQESAQMSGIPASFTIAQAALESSWGKSQLAQQGFNLFGVKADKWWSGLTLCLPTTEYVGGKCVNTTANWRKYRSWLEAIDDHARFLRVNPRYKLAFTGKRTGSDFANQVALAGYATDPRYAEKISTIIRQHKLDKFDLAQETQ